MGIIEWLDSALQDVRYGLRTISANKTFSLLAILSLALGIGANTAIYSFMDSLLMRSLPVSGPESLAVLNWGANPAGREDHTDYPWVLLLCRINANGRRAGTVTDQHHSHESSLLGKINPSGEVPHFLASDSPIAAATDPFITPPCLDVSEVMHARVAGNGGVTALSQRAANRNVRRLVKIHSPSMNQNDGDRLGRILRDCKNRATIEDIILRSYIDELFGESSCTHPFGSQHALSPNQKSSP